MILQTLLCPVMFGSIGEKTLYIFAASNMVAIPIVWALYPESNQRTLEDMDMLFAADTPWAWDAERTYARLKAEKGEIPQSSSRKGSMKDLEMGKTLSLSAKTEEEVTAAHVD